MQSMTLKDSQQTVKTEVQFLIYGTRSSKEKSGAYLFLPDGPAKSLEYENPLVRVIMGPVVSEVHSILPHVHHVVRLYSSPGSLEVSEKLVPETPHQWAYYCR